MFFRSVCEEVEKDPDSSRTINGMVHLSSPYTVPETLRRLEYLKQRHNIPDDLVKNIGGIGVLLQKALE